MSKIREITVSLDLTVQPKQYQSVKLGITVTEQIDEDDQEMSMATLKEYVHSLRSSVSETLREGLRAEVETVYGKATADYVVNQKGV